MEVYMNCKNCGTELSEGSKFCSNCGCRIEIECTDEKNVFKEQLMILLN